LRKSSERRSTAPSTRRTPRSDKALDCDVTYADVPATKIREVSGKDVHFEMLREDHKPPLKDLFDGPQDG
jgi:hypothetical protein